MKESQLNAACHKARGEELVASHLLRYLSLPPVCKYVVILVGESSLCRSRGGVTLCCNCLRWLYDACCNEIA